MLKATLEVFLSWILNFPVTKHHAIFYVSCVIHASLMLSITLIYFVGKILKYSLLY